ncbi:helix-turn-helix transcriptional regulator [Streptomyces sp. NPDC023327]|uniref:helix-turn-helix domain-containing protein n=1 Tax=Streptomyces sp. NPDC023327 TaxID=3157088 RepID=UPI0033F5F68C
MAEQDDGAGFLRCFGQQLKLLRERAGLTRAELGSRLGYGEDQITLVERGRRIPKPELIDRADEVLNAGGALRAMKKEVARARYPAFFRDAARLKPRRSSFRRTTPMWSTACWSYEHPKGHCRRSGSAVVQKQLQRR